jgi:peroxiredoxin
MAEPLKLGDTFPTFTVPIVQGGTLTIPGDLTTSYTAVLFYRASW